MQQKEPFFPNRTVPWWCRQRGFVRICGTNYAEGIPMGQICASRVIGTVLYEKNGSLVPTRIPKKKDVTF